MTAKTRALSFLLLSACLFILAGCALNDNREKYSIICIHSYGEYGQEGSYFRNLMDREFRAQKINADVTHIYLDLIGHEFPALSLYGGTPGFIQAIESIRPDILLINDDLALEYIFDNCDTLLQMQPTVFAGVSAPREWDSAKYPYLCGIMDRISLAANADLAVRTFGSKEITVAIGNDDYQRRLKKTILQSIADSSRFINNSAFEIDVTNEKTYLSESDERIIVNFLSLEDPKSNRKKGAPEEDGVLTTQRAKLSALSDTPSQIQVCYDIFSNGIIDYDKRPQFTCIREMFGSESEGNDKKVRTRFLGGYFTGIETQISDQVGLAARIIRGASPSNIPTATHDHNYYMDWLAMEKCNPPLEYKDYKTRFEIINVPFTAKYRFLSNFLFGLAIFIVSLGVSTLCIHFINKKKRKKTKRLTELNDEIDKRSLVLDDLETGFFMIKDDLVSFYFGFSENHGIESNIIPLDRFKKAVHSDYQGVFMDALSNADSNSHREKITRIKLDFNGKGWHWWSLYLDAPSPDSTIVIGSIVNIDNVVQMEDNARETAMKAEEVLSKENFIANITHDIRTPLNAISGFSELLLDTDTTAKEKEEYMEIISDNTTQLLDLLEEAATMRPDNTETMSFKIREINFDKLLSDSYKTNRILCPKNLDFIFEPDSHKDTIALCDSIRTCQVINNFLSNAFKYTPSGSITLGWKLIDNGTAVEVYVRDTGIGISDEDKKIINQRYGRALGNRQGTGLGLDICQKIISLQNGRYGFESELGKGSCFHFSLPVINKPEKTKADL